MLTLTGFMLLTNLQSGAFARPSDDNKEIIV
jgi:hypothetical protein